MDRLDDIMRQATTEITDGYFRLWIQDSARVYRERVYCYELYHQMRKIWPEDAEYVLNAEVDKSGHKFFKVPGLKNAKPDLLVHQPGNMDQNFAAIEVKRSMASRSAIRDDINKVRALHEHAGYRRMIFLLFGDISLKTAIKHFKEQAEPYMELWVHKRSCSPAELVDWINLNLDAI